MPVVYLMAWTESERGWGQRPDGYSLHASRADYDAYLAAHHRGLSAAVPDEYSFPDGALLAVEASESLAKAVALQGSVRYWQRALVVEVSDTGTRSVREATPAAPKSFLDLCLQDPTLLGSVDEFVERWHTGAAGAMPLHDYLGLSLAEYEAFLTSPDSLYKVFHQRKLAAR